MRVNRYMPPLGRGEYDTVVPTTSHGLMMNVLEVNGAVVFNGYKQLANGVKGPAELSNCVLTIGDKFIGVDGIQTIGKSFDEVVVLLRRSANNRYAFLRFRGVSSAATVFRGKNIVVRSHVPVTPAVHHLNAHAPAAPASSTIAMRGPISKTPGMAKVYQVPTQTNHSTESVSATNANTAALVKLPVRLTVAKTPALPKLPMSPNTSALFSATISNTAALFKPPASATNANTAALAKLPVRPNTSALFNATIGNPAALFKPPASATIGNPAALFKPPASATIGNPAALFKQPASATVAKTTALFQPPASATVANNPALAKPYQHWNLVPTPTLAKLPQYWPQAPPYRNNNSLGYASAPAAILPQPRSVRATNVAKRAAASNDVNQQSRASYPPKLMGKKLLEKIALGVKVGCLVCIREQEHGRPMGRHGKHAWNCVRNKDFGFATSAESKAPKTLALLEKPNVTPKKQPTSSAHHHHGTRQKITQNESTPSVLDISDVQVAVQGAGEADSKEPPRKRICASKTVLGDDYSLPHKRRKVMASKSVLVYRVVEAKWAEEYDEKELRRVPITYAMRLDDIKQQDEAKGYLAEENKTVRREKKSAARQLAAEGNAARKPPRGRAVATTPVKKVKSRKSSSPKSQPRTPKLIYAGPPTRPLDGGWPEGWIQKTFQRFGGSSCDSYFYPPTKIQRLRSLVEVKRFLSAAEKCGGDEEAAVLLKGRAM